MKTYDAIFLCNGHYSAPYMPQFDGIDEFRGAKMHSHDYRKPDRYQDETLLIIGCGPSGRDILYEVASKAKKVILSHHRNLTGHILPTNVKQVGDVKCFTTDSVQFLDDTEEYISCVLFCTGERYLNFILDPMFIKWIYPNNNNSVRSSKMQVTHIHSHFSRWIVA